MTEFQEIAIPLEENAQGVIHVTGTRVSLDSILYAYFNDGATAEEIVFRFPTCALEDIYTVLSWVLKNTDFVRGYLERQSEQQATRIATSKQQYPAENWKAQLLARRG